MPFRIADQGIYREISLPPPIYCVSLVCSCCVLLLPISVCLETIEDHDLYSLCHTHGRITLHTTYIDAHKCYAKEVNQFITVYVVVAVVVVVVIVFRLHIRFNSLTHSHTPRRPKPPLLNRLYSQRIVLLFLSVYVYLLSSRLGCCDFHFHRLLLYTNINNSKNNTVFSQRYSPN